MMKGGNMIDYQEELKNQVAELDKLIEFVEKSLNREKLTKNQQVCVCKKGEVYQYYLVENGGKRRYVKKRDMDNVRRILQQDYYERVYGELLIMRNRIKKFLGKYDLKAISGVYERLGDGRKDLVTPVIMTDEEYIARWIKKYPGNQNSYPKNQQYPTKKGEVVRSKSEKILADMFYQYDIPYNCEPHVKLKDGTHACPDFVLLNVRKRKTYFWEHFGLLAKEGYAKDNWEKLRNYEDIGFYPGENFLYTMETEKQSLDIKRAENMIKRYLI